MADDGQLTRDDGRGIVGSEWRSISLRVLGSASDSDMGLDCWWQVVSTDGSIDDAIRARSLWDARQLCKEKWPGIRFSDYDGSME